MRAIDLFCGCGGMSAGLADEGVDVIGGVDVDKKYIQTFSHNFGSEKAVIADLGSIDSGELLERLDVRSSEVDMIVGGPPCQGFSKNVPRSQRVLDSANNKLVKSFVSICLDIKPSFVVMENVAEMKRGFDSSYSEFVLSKFAESGYTTISMTLNSADYGVPQKRRRAFFIAAKGKCDLRLPPPSHLKSSTQNELWSDKKSHVKVWEAIGDLPSLKSGEGDEITTYTVQPTNSFQKQARKNVTGVRNHIAKKLSSIQQERLSSLKPGEGLKQLPDHIRPKGGYSGAYGRLTKDMVAPTITRWVFHPGSGRYGHPVDERVITIREAARLQGFRDSFTFCGSYTEQAGQIGNAVPPILMQAVVKSIKKSLA